MLIFKTNKITLSAFIQGVAIPQSPQAGPCLCTCVITEGAGIPMATFMTPCPYFTKGEAGIRRSYNISSSPTTPHLQVGNESRKAHLWPKLSHPSHSEGTLSFQTPNPAQSPDARTNQLRSGIHPKVCPLVPQGGSGRTTGHLTPEAECRHVVKEHCSCHQIMLVSILKNCFSPPLVTQMTSGYYSNPDKRFVPLQQKYLCTALPSLYISLKAKKPSFMQASSLETCLGDIGRDAGNWLNASCLVETVFLQCWNIVFYKTDHYWGDIISMHGLEDFSWQSWR